MKNTCRARFAVALLGLATASTFAGLFPPGLTHYYPFEGTAEDALGGNDGTITGNVTFVQSPVGQGASFADENARITIPGAPFNFGTADFSIAFWSRASTGVASQQVMSKRPACGCGQFFDIRTSGTSYGLEMYAVCQSQYAGVVTNSEIVGNDWHFIVFTRSGTRARVYVDGLLDNERIAPAVGIVNVTANLILNFGPCVNLDSTESFNGQIDELQIYNVELTGSDVENLFGAVACPDGDDDGDVDFDDLNLVLANWASEVEVSTNGDVAPLGGDGLVNFADLNAVLAKFGTACPE